MQHIVRICTSVTEDVAAAARQQAVAEDRSVASIMRTALMKYLVDEAFKLALAREREQALANRRQGSPQG